MNEHGSNEHEQYLTYMKKTKTVALICEAQTNIALFAQSVGLIHTKFATASFTCLSWPVCKAVLTNVE